MIVASVSRPLRGLLRVRMALGACAMRRHNVVLSMLLMGAARSEPVYSMVLSSNSPAKFRLAQLSTTTGMATTIGPEHSEVIACGDLVATANGLLFYLGDTTAGAMLVALNLTTGEKSCEAPVNLEEIKLVGLGQTLDYDSTTNTLVLSGIAHESEHRRNGNISHVVFRVSATGCGPFRKVGGYGVADYLPMLHASSLDASGQRLFVTLSKSKTAEAIGVIDLKQEGGGGLRLIAEGMAADFHDSLVGMHWDPSSARLVGVMGVGPSLQLHALDPTGKGTWEPSRKVLNAPTQWHNLGGNDATASALSFGTRSLIFLAGFADGKQGPYHFELASVNIDASAVTSHPAVGPVGMPGCTNCILALTL
jgi:hypothetical protein